MFIKERVWAKLQGWKEQLLPQAGREVLLKTVVQAIPTFSMSCFKLPVTLCNDIEQLIRKFWWGHRGNQRKIHWSKWSTLCLPKDLGCMGFKELQKFNDAMLAKQVWRLLENKNSLFHCFFKEFFYSKWEYFYRKGRQWILCVEKHPHWKRGHKKGSHLESWKWQEHPHLPGQVAASPLVL